LGAKELIPLFIDSGSSRTKKKQKKNLPFVANGCIIFSANEKHHHERQTRHYHPRHAAIQPVQVIPNKKKAANPMTYEEAIEAETLEEARAEINPLTCIVTKSFWSLKTNILQVDEYDPN
jgi:hypothetical protein